MDGSRWSGDTAFLTSSQNTNFPPAQEYHCFFHSRLTGSTPASACFVTVTSLLIDEKVMCRHKIWRQFNFCIPYRLRVQSIKTQDAHQPLMHRHFFKFLGCAEDGTLQFSNMFPVSITSWVYPTTHLPTLAVIYLKRSNCWCSRQKF